MSDFILVFIAAHLIGDYVLQTNKIAKMKSGAVGGVALHSLIVLVVQVVFLSLFGIKGLIAGAAGGLIHFLLDCAKIPMNRLFKKFESVYFLIDQALHLGVIWLLSALLQPPERIHDAYSTYMVFIKILICVIILCYVSTVTVKIFIRDLFTDLKSQGFFRKRERIIDALLSILLFAAWLLHPGAGAAATAAAFYPYHGIQLKNYGYSLKISIVKYLVLAAISFIAALAF